MRDQNDRSFNSLWCGLLSKLLSTYLSTCSRQILVWVRSINSNECPGTQLGIRARDQTATSIPKEPFVVVSAVDMNDGPRQWKTEWTLDGLSKPRLFQSIRDF